MRTAHEPQVEATIRSLTFEEGGRRTPVTSGYRGQFHYEGEVGVPHDGFQFFPDVLECGFVDAGTTVRSAIWFPTYRWADFH